MHWKFIFVAQCLYDYSLYAITPHIYIVELYAFRRGWGPIEIRCVTFSMHEISWIHSSLPHFEARSAICPWRKFVKYCWLVGKFGFRCNNTPCYARTALFYNTLRWTLLRTDIVQHISRRKDHPVPPQCVVWTRVGQNGPKKNYVDRFFEKQKNDTGPFRLRPFCPALPCTVSSTSQPQLYCFTTCGIWRSFTSFNALRRVNESISLRHVEQMFIQ